MCISQHETAAPEATPQHQDTAPHATHRSNTQARPFKVGTHTHIHTSKYRCRPEYSSAVQNHIGTRRPATVRWRIIPRHTHVDADLCARRCGERMRKEELTNTPAPSKHRPDVADCGWGIRQYRAKIPGAPRPPEPGPAAASGSGVRRRWHCLRVVRRERGSGGGGVGHTPAPELSTARMVCQYGANAHGAPATTTRNAPLHPSAHADHADVRAVPRG